MLFAAFGIFIVVLLCSMLIFIGMMEWDDGGGMVLSVILAIFAGVFFYADNGNEGLTDNNTTVTQQVDLTPVTSLLSKLNERVTVLEARTCECTPSVEVITEDPYGTGY